MKKILSLILSLALALSFCGCGQEVSENIPTEAPKPVTESTVPATEPASETAGNWDLFETVFMPFSRGEIGREQEELTAYLDEHGWNWQFGEGSIYIDDPQHPGSYLSCYPTFQGEGGEMSYSYIIKQGQTIDETIQRGVLVRFPYGVAQYFIQTNWLGDGVQVETPEEMAEYMTAADLSPDELTVDGLRPEETDVGFYQNKMTDILTGTVDFISLDLTHPEHGSMNLTISEYCDAASSADARFTVSKAAAVDMDGDGFREILLNFRVGENEEAGMLLLHYQDQQVFGRQYSHRQLGQVKTDGTFFWSGGAGYNGTARLDFGTYDSKKPFHEYSWEKVVIHQVDYDRTDGGPQYMANGVEADEDAFLVAIQAQGEKEDVRWFDYPMADFSQLFR